MKHKSLIHVCYINVCKWYCTYSEISLKLTKCTAHHKYREDWKFNYQCTIKTWKFNYQYTIKPPKVTVLRNGKCFNDGEKWEYKGNNLKVVNQFNWSFIYAETQGNKPLSRVYSKNEWVIKSMLCYGGEIGVFIKVLR